MSCLLHAVLITLGIVVSWGAIGTITYIKDCENSNEKADLEGCIIMGIMGPIYMIAFLFERNKLKHESLEKELEEAIEKEDYERCAEIIDILK